MANEEKTPERVHRRRLNIWLVKHLPDEKQRIKASKIMIDHYEELEKRGLMERKEDRYYVYDRQDTYLMNTLRREIPDLEIRTRKSIRKEDTEEFQSFSRWVHSHTSAKNYQDVYKRIVGSKEPREKYLEQRGSGLAIIPGKEQELLSWAKANLGEVFRERVLKKTPDSGWYTPYGAADKLGLARAPGCRYIVELIKERAVLSEYLQESNRGHFINEEGLEVIRQLAAKERPTLFRKANEVKTYSPSIPAPTQKEQEGTPSKLGMPLEEFIELIGGGEEALQEVKKWVEARDKGVLAYVAKTSEGYKLQSSAEIVYIDFKREIEPRLSRLGMIRVRPKDKYSNRIEEDGSRKSVANTKTTWVSLTTISRFHKIPEDKLRTYIPYFGIARLVDGEQMFDDAKVDAFLFDLKNKNATKADTTRPEIKKQKSPSSKKLRSTAEKTPEQLGLISIEEIIEDNNLSEEEIEMWEEKFGKVQAIKGVLYYDSRNVAEVIKNIEREREESGGLESVVS
jgi:hypothetical protein